MGSKSYDAKVDIWSLGCFFTELFLGKTLFPGDTDPRQLTLIFDLCGTPSSKKWKNYKYLKAQIRDEIERKTYKRRLQEFLVEKGGDQFEDPALIDLLDNML